jgi:hypothetical protein
MKSISSRFLAISFLVMGLTFLETKSVKSATVTYNFTISPDFGPLVGNSYNGNLSYDDSTLTGTSSDSIPLLSFYLPFEGSIYTLATAPTATADFTFNNFLGVTFSAPNATLTSGTSDISEAFFSYDLGGVGNAGTGTIMYSQVNTIPESQPLSILGSIITLGLGAILKH